MSGNFKMEETFIPEVNKVYVFDEYSLLILEHGQGLFQVDFRNYDFPGGKVIFLSPGQYFQLLAGQYEISIIKLPQEKINQTNNSRYLFKHLVSLGYINMTHPKHFHLNQLRYLDVNDRNTTLLTTAIKQWLFLNPFGSSHNETNVLFDIKDIVDEKYREPISLGQISKILNEKPYHLNRLTKEKLKYTVNQLTKSKLLLEACRKVVFTDLTSKEIAYELGFKDPAYFNRFFKINTQKTPYELREAYEIEQKNTFVSELMNLVDLHYRDHHTMAFYADQLNMSSKTLIKKLNNKLGTSLHQLLKNKLIQEASKLLNEELPVNIIAFELGFKEPNHFSTFFKTHTGKTPTEYQEFSKMSNHWG